jgi:hypothetical protein
MEKKQKNAAAEPVEYRENQRTNEKIDAWIKNYPDRFKFFDELPHDRAVRKLVLNEVERYERFQKSKSYNQQKVDGDAELKKACEIIMERVPETERDRVTANIAREIFQPTTQRNDKAKTQSAGVKVG